jgi:uncharacterized protein (DUF2384 family)
MRIKTLRKGIEIFGKEKFQLWLSTPNYAMGNKKPIMCTLEEIYAELIKIEHGILI